MRHWFKDGVFRAVLRNAGYLGSTKLVHIPYRGTAPSVNDLLVKAVAIST